VTYDVTHVRLKGQGRDPDTFGAISISTTVQTAGMGQLDTAFHRTYSSSSYYYYYLFIAPGTI